MVIRWGDFHCCESDCSGRCHPLALSVIQNPSVMQWLWTVSVLVQEWCFSAVLCYRSDLFGWCEKGATGSSFSGHESDIKILRMLELPNSLHWSDSSVICRLVTKLFSFWNYSWWCDCFHLLNWLWLCQPRKSCLFDNYLSEESFLLQKPLQVMKAPFLQLADE